MDTAPNSFQNEVRGEIGFVTKFVVERIPCGCVRRDALGVGAVGLTEPSGTVGAVTELLGGFVEVVASLVGDDEFDKSGTSDLHISYRSYFPDPIGDTHNGHL